MPRRMSAAPHKWRSKLGEGELLGEFEVGYGLSSSKYLRLPLSFLPQRASSVLCRNVGRGLQQYKVSANFH